MSFRLPFSDDLSSETLTNVARLVQQHGVLIVPTETYYALAASPFDEKAVQRVCEIKGRSDGKPILVLIADRTQLTHVVADIPPAAESLMDQFWPGPLTLVLRAAQKLPRLLTGGTGTVGVRQPGHPHLLRLLKRVGPLTGTSANRTGSQPFATAEEVEAIMSGDVDAILNGGRTSGGLPSTVVDVTGPIRILREGPIDRQTIERLLCTHGFTVGNPLH